MVSTRNFLLLRLSFQNTDYGSIKHGRECFGRGGTGSDTSYVDGLLSNVILIDGLALGPENFGFTDPLTNTWRPKKYTGRRNCTSKWMGYCLEFYLPMYVTNGPGGQAPSNLEWKIQTNTGYSYLTGSVETDTSSI